jgi:hypothetical protein
MDIVHNKTGYVIPFCFFPAWKRVLGIRCSVFVQTFEVVEIVQDVEDGEEKYSGFRSQESEWQIGVRPRLGVRF